MQDDGCRMQDDGCRMANEECGMADVDAGCFLHPASGMILHPGCAVQQPANRLSIWPMQTATRPSKSTVLTRILQSPVGRFVLTALIVLGAVAAGIAYVKFFR